MERLVILRQDLILLDGIVINSLKDARKNVADLIKCDTKEIVWTSGATESNNLAIKGAAHFYKSKGNHLITLSTEHKAVLDTMRQLS